MNSVVFLKKKISKLIQENLPLFTVEQLKINEIEKNEMDFAEEVASMQSN